MNRRYRKTIIAGNWKMNKTITETKEYAAQMRDILGKPKWCEAVLLVPLSIFRPVCAPLRT